MTFMLCKSLMFEQPEKALLILQMNYTQLPLYNSILYQYGKNIIKNPRLHAVNLAGGISALEEVVRTSCQVRKAKAYYWLSIAYLENSQLTNAGLYQNLYLSSIVQVTRCGTVKYKPIIDRVDVSVQTQVLDKIKSLKLEKNNLSQADTSQKTESCFKSPIAPLDG